MRMKITIDDIITILDTHNCLEGHPLTTEEVAITSRDIYECYRLGFKCFPLVYKSFRGMVWDVFEYYENETDSEEYKVAKRLIKGFIKDAYLVY